jgi:hypothetical protein
MATNVSLEQLLSTYQVTRVISTIKQPQSRVQDYLGMGMDGRNVESPGGHVAGYDQFNRTRTMAKGRAPAVGPATSAPQVIGHVAMTMARFHEKIPILAEKVFRTRPLGQNWGAVDASGQSYITKQERFLAQKFVNAREFMCSRMLLGSHDFLISGDDVNPVETGSGNFTVNFQIPAGNKNQMAATVNSTDAAIIERPWNDPAADIIGQFFKMNAAQEALTGRPIRDVWVNSVTMAPLFKNTGLLEAAGIANTVWSRFERTEFRGPDGVQDTGLEVVFKGIPYMAFHSYDALLVDYAGNNIKVIPDNRAVILPAVDFDWCSWMNGSELVMENLLDQGTERFGFAAWTTQVIDPAGWDLKAVLNGLPALYVPNCVFSPTVIY